MIRRSVSSKALALAGSRMENLPLEYLANNLQGKESALKANPSIREFKGTDAAYSKGLWVRRVLNWCA